MQSWLLSLLARQTILIGTESNNSILKSKLINLIPKYLKYQGKTLPLRRIKIFKRNQIGTLKGHPVYPRSQSTNYYLHVLSERYFFNLLFKIITDFIITWAIFSSALLSLFWIVRVLPPAPPPPPLFIWGFFTVFIESFLLQFSSINSCSIYRRASTLCKQHTALLYSSLFCIWRLL